MQGPKQKQIMFFQDNLLKKKVQHEGETVALWSDEYSTGFMSRSENFMFCALHKVTEN